MIKFYLIRFFSQSTPTALFKKHLQQHSAEEGCHVVKTALGMQQGVQHPPLFFRFFPIFPRFSRKNRGFFTPIFTIKR